MSDNIKEANTFNPDKVIQSIESEIEQDRQKNFRTKVKELVKKKKDAEAIVNNIRREIDQYINEFKADV